MPFASSRLDPPDWVDDRRLQSASIALFAVACLSWLGAPVGPELPGLLVGLAAHGDRDRNRDGAFERLTADLESLVAAVRRDDTDAGPEERADRIRNAVALEDLDSDDDVGQLAGVIDDLATAVAERERTVAERERELATRTARLEAFDRSPDMIDVLDTEGTIVDANRRFCEQLGYSEGELVGTGIWEHDQLYDEREVRDLLADLSSGERRKFEGRYERRDGSTFPVEIHLIRLDLEPEDRVLVISRDVTDRKERERELRERDRRLSTLMSNVPGMVYRCRNERGWSFEFVSEGCAELTGYEPGQLVAGDVSWGEDVIQEYHDEIWENVQRAVTDREPFQLTFPVETADGERRWVTERGRGVYADDGSIEALEGVITDATERIENERELERTTRLLEQSQQLAKIGAWELDVRGESPDLRWTDEVARIHGLEPPVDVDLETSFEFYQPGDRPEIRAAVDRAIESGESYDLELRLDPADGDSRWVRSIGEPVREDGEIVKLQGSIQDITERKRRERDLRETKRRLELALEGTNTGIWELNLETKELEWNDTLQEIVGLEPGSFEGTHEAFLERVHPEDVDRIEAALERAIERDELYRDGFRIRHENGEWIWLGGRGRLVVDADGTRRMVGINNDVTERKRLENELERTLDRISDAFHAIDTDWNFTYVNEKAKELLDAQDRELTGCNLWEEFPSAVDSRFESEYRRAMATQESVTFEEYSPVVDGWVEVTAYPSESGLSVYFRDVTERKRLEREREARLERITDGFLAIDTDWRYTYCNDRAQEILERDESEMLEERVWDVFPGIDDSAFGPALREAMETTEPQSVEAYYEPVDTWFRVHIYPSETGLSVYFRDVSDRKESQLRYEAIFNHTYQFTGLMDPDGTLLEANETALEFGSLDREDVVGVPIWEAYWFQTDDQTIQQLKDDVRRAADGAFVNHELEVQGADERIIIDFSIKPVYDERGEVTLLVPEGRDITELKERERELERYETIVQSIGDPVYTLGPDGEIQFVNEAIESLTGYPSEELIGEHVSTLFEEADLERARETVRKLLREEEPYDTVETTFQTADDGAVEAETHIALLPMDDGEFAGTAGVIRDITERVERERDLERTRDLLERVQRMAEVGGWELDLDDEPRTATWTDEMYRLHDLSRDVSPDLEATIACYHPDDRPFVRNELETAIETETGYDLEARLQTDAGDVRWVRAISEPIHDEDGDLATYRGAVKDISDRKRRELALELLHETARGLLNAERESDVADLVVETAADLLETDEAGAGVYLLDADTNRFEPAAVTPAFADRTGGAPPVAVGDDDALLWTTYVTGSQTVVDDAAIGDDSPLFGGDATGGVLVPVGDHGVFVAVAPPSTIDDETRQLFETLVATTEAAFDRLESEAALRERDAELEAQNRRLRRQIQVTEIIRRIDKSLIGAESRDEIERTVAERLVEADTVDFAWIGDLDASGSELEPRAWAGTEPDYLDAVPVSLEDGAEPAVRTARTGTPTVVENVVEELQREAWRRDAIEAGFQSAVAVPISFEEYSYGVLTVYADEPDAFTDLEQSVFAELGEGIANAITAAKTREALHSETLVELTLELSGDDDVLSRIASSTGATVGYEGLGTHSGSETALFFETRGVDADAVRETLADLVSVTDARLVTESDDTCLFEATVTGDDLASRLVRHGASPRSIVADGERTEITVDVPTGTDVREFVAMLRDRYPAVDFQSRRDVQRAMQTRGELVASLLEPLTDRQREVLRTAYLAGFFEWPRETTGEELADVLDVTQPTVNRHLRIGQQRLLGQLFAAEDRSLADGA